MTTTLHFQRGSQLEWDVEQRCWVPAGALVFNFRARHEERRLAVALEAFQAHRHLGDTEAMRKALEAAEFS